VVFRHHPLEILHRFADIIGDLYSTTAFGGGGQGGTVFKLTPNLDGTWTESVLHSFTGTDGEHPDAGLIFDAAGNLYGTTFNGGISGGSCPSGCGVIFKLRRNSDGTWTESVLHSFTGADGANPFAGLIFDAAGNLYGTTTIGGNPSCSNGCGTVFRLTPNSDGTWTESVIHSFANHPAATPFAGLIFDAAGNLDGTTDLGGNAGGGTAFRLTPNSNGSWAFRVLHVFQGKSALRPHDNLILDKAGNLFGTTEFCGSGTGCDGVVFEITP